MASHLRFGVDEPLALIDVEHIGAEEGDRVVKGAFEFSIAVAISVTVTMPMTMPIVVSTERSLFAADRFPAKCAALRDLGEQVHAVARSAGSSLATSPSRMRMMRRAWRATSSSCVTTMSVWPLAESV